VVNVAPPPAVNIHMTVLKASHKLTLADLLRMAREKGKENAKAAHAHEHRHEEREVVVVEKRTTTRGHQCIIHEII
jgi:hypothetical protein